MSKVLTSPWSEVRKALTEKTAPRIPEPSGNGPSAPSLESLEDLAGKEVVVRASSSYYESLQLLNDLFKSQGREPVKVTPSAEYLEDEDLLEMVANGLIPMIIVDSHKAEFWAQIFEDITLHRDIAVATNGQIGWLMAGPPLEIR